MRQIYLLEILAVILVLAISIETIGALKTLDVKAAITNGGVK